MDIEKRYREIENLLYTRHSYKKKNGLEHIKKILDKLGNPHKKIGKVIHITGTNGKGSVAYITESIIRNMGFKTALFTSPHITELTERIKINGNDISKYDFVRIFEENYKYFDELSFFEIITLIAFIYFQNKVDYSIIEVGIGGLYDTTNVFEDTVLCFITSVDLDHMDMLGRTKKDIAFQKSGIIKKNSICVVPEYSSEVKEIILERCKILNAKFIEVKDIFKIKGYDLKKRLMNIIDEDNNEFESSLIGVKQTLNISMVLKGLKEIGLKIEKDIIRKALKDVRIRGRFEIIHKAINSLNKTFIIDGSHNPQAISIFIENIKRFNIINPVLIFSILSTKDYKEVIKIISSSKVFDKIIITEINNPKKLNAITIANEFSTYKNSDISVISDHEAAIRYAISSSNVIAIAGSFYLISDAIKIIEERL